MSLLQIDEVASALKEEVWAETWERVMALIPEPTGASEVLDAESARQVFLAIHERIEALARSLAPALGSYEWLWYVRRLPAHLFAARLPTTGAGNWLLTEILSASSNITEGPTEAEAINVHFPVTEDRIRVVLQMAALAIHLSNARKAMRRAAKGQRYTRTPLGFPTPIQDPKLDAAIRLLDERVNADRQADHGISLIADWGPDSSDHPLLTVVGTYSEWAEVPARANPIEDGTFDLTLGRYVVGWKSLDTLVRTVKLAKKRTEAWWEPTLPALVILLSSLAARVHGDRSADLNIPKVGYHLTARATLVAQLTEDIPELTRMLEDVFGTDLPRTGEDILGLLELLRPSTLPVTYGPVLRHWGTMSLSIWRLPRRGLL